MGVCHIRLSCRRNGEKFISKWSWMCITWSKNEKKERFTNVDNNLCLILGTQICMFQSKHIYPAIWAHVKEFTNARHHLNKYYFMLRFLTSNSQIWQLFSFVFNYRLLHVCRDLLKCTDQVTFACGVFRHFSRSPASHRSMNACWIRVLKENWDIWAFLCHLSGKDIFQKRKMIRSVKLELKIGM